MEPLEIREKSIKNKGVYINFFYILAAYYPILPAPVQI